jgi:hypothetical protein
VAFCCLLTGSTQVIYVLTKSKLSTEHKHVAKCSSRPRNVSKSNCRQKTIHILRTVRVFVSSAVCNRAVRAFPDLLCPVARSCWRAGQWAILNARPQVSVVRRQTVSSYNRTYAHWDSYWCFCLGRLAVRHAITVVWNVAVVQGVQLTTEPAGTVGYATTNAEEHYRPT